MEKDHEHEQESEIEFNCMDCCYQGHNQQDLMRHIAVTHKGKSTLNLVIVVGKRLKQSLSC